MSIDDETLLLVAAYHDGELSPSETLSMERRFATEPELRALAADFRKLSRRLTEILPADDPPHDLRAKIISQTGLGDTVTPLDRRRPAWMALAASLLVGMVVGAGIVAGVSFRTTSWQAATSDVVYSAHLRSLVAPQPFDIASSDRHVVKPWFNGKTAIAPATPDLAGRGFPLIGGRVDIVAGAPVPVLVYRHDRHIISVTILPGQPGASNGEESHDGFNIQGWDSGDLTYLAVSDLNSVDLRQFVAAFQSTR